jgi:hypothetical protein
MRTIVAAAAIALLASTTTYAVKEALTEQQIEGVQMAIKAMGCTVEDNNIEAEGAGYEADDVICKDDVQYDVSLDKGLQGDQEGQRGLAQRVDKAYPSPDAHYDRRRGFFRSACLPISLTEGARLFMVRPA